MPNALTFIIGADSKPFAQEMRLMEQIASRSSRSISSGMADATSHSYSGIIRESITIVREAIEGRGIGRIIGSGTLLAQYLRNMATGAKEAGTEAQLSADKFRLLALRASQAAGQAIEDARIAERRFSLNKFANEEDLKQGILAEKKVAESVKLAATLEQQAKQQDLVVEIEKAEGMVAKDAAQATSLWVSKILSFIPALAGLTIAAVIAHNLAKGFREIADGAELAANKLGNITARLEANSRSMKTLTDQMQDFKEWQDKINTPDNTVSKELQERLKLMREEFELVQKLAKLRGQKPEDAEAASLSQKQKELAEIEQAVNSAGAYAAHQMTRANHAESHLEEVAPQRENAEIAKQQADHQAKILAAVMGEFDSQTSTHGIMAAIKSDTFAQLYSDIVGKRGDQLVNVKVDGKEISMSLNQAKAGYDAANKQEAANEAIVRQAEKDAKDTRAEADRAKKQSEDLQKQATESEQSLDLQKKYGPDIAKLEQDKHHGRGGTRAELNDMQKIGFAYIGEGVQKQTDLLRQIAHNTQHKTPSSGGSHGQERPHY